MGSTCSSCQTPAPAALTADQFQSLRATCARLGLVGVSLHSFRRTAAQDAVGRGVPLAIVVAAHPLFDGGLVLIQKNVGFTGQLSAKIKRCAFPSNASDRRFRASGHHWHRRTFLECACYQGGWLVFDDLFYSCRLISRSAVAGKLS